MLSLFCLAALVLLHEQESTWGHCDIMTCITLFLLISQDESEEIKFESYARIEHVLSGRWLHADSGK